MSILFSVNKDVFPGKAEAGKTGNEELLRKPNHDVYTI